MSFMKFTKLNKKNDQQVGVVEQSILLNSNHIISIKPIKMLLDDNNVVDGYWIRTSNGKKYKATKIPLEIKIQLDEIPNTYKETNKLQKSAALN